MFGKSADEQEIARLTAELERLRNILGSVDQDHAVEKLVAELGRVNSSYDNDMRAWTERVQRLEAELAQAQAREAKLREALFYIGNESSYFEEATAVARHALTSTHDTMIGQDLHKGLMGEEG